MGVIIHEVKIFHSIILKKKIAGSLGQKKGGEELLYHTVRNYFIVPVTRGCLRKVPRGVQDWQARKHSHLRLSAHVLKINLPATTSDFRNDVGTWGQQT